MREETAESNARLLEYLSYNPETGEVTWLKSPNTQVPAGTVTKGGVDDSGYRRIRFMQKRYRIHRVACFLMWGFWPKEVDHINMDRTDNRWVNLRLVTRSQNLANRRKLSTNKSGYKGVCWHKRSRAWRAQIKHEGKVRYLGQFATPELAHKAYCEAAELHFGTYRRLA
jgi:hypothetical protein